MADQRSIVRFWQIIPNSGTIFSITASLSRYPARLLFDPRRTDAAALPGDPFMNQSTTASYAALLLRVSLGVMFVAHALLKLLVFTLPGTVQFFESLGLPGPLAYLTFAAELAGGVLLILGVRVRLVALALVPFLLGATWVHLGNGWLFSAKNGGWEYPLFWTVTLLVQALLGDGAFALRFGNAGRASNLQAA
jgi:putative oxidoreductase